MMPVGFLRAEASAHAHWRSAHSWLTTDIKKAFGSKASDERLATTSPYAL
jgi:hypothetical protein